jgi:hypothetical protein
LQESTAETTIVVNINATHKPVTMKPLEMYLLKLVAALPNCFDHPSAAWPTAATHVLAGVSTSLQKALDFILTGS